MGRIIAGRSSVSMHLPRYVPKGWVSTGAPSEREGREKVKVDFGHCPRSALQIIIMTWE